MLSVSCGACGEAFLVSQETIGEQATCPACGQAVQVSAEEQEQDLGPMGDNPWEYSVLVDMGRMGHVDAKKLNAMGWQGWELVSVFKESEESHTVFYFKRPVKKQ